MNEELRAEVKRFAQDAADVQTKWLAEEIRANAAEDDLRALRDRLAVMARRLEAEPFISETSARIARELRDLIPTPTAGGKVDTAPEAGESAPWVDQWAKCSNPDEHEPHWHTIRADGITYGGGRCDGHPRPADTAPESGEGR